MSFSGDLAEQSRSMEFFMNPANYGQFDLNSNKQRTYGCIDPRDEERPSLHIIMQTAGGAAGLAYDQTIAYAAHKGNGANLQEGVDYDSRLRTVTVASGHFACAFLHGVAKVNDEIAQPSDMTKDTLDRLAMRYKLYDRPTFRSDIEKVKAAAERNRATFIDIKPDEFLHAVDSSYPLHENVGKMVGSNAAGIYVLNHHPYVGLDRAKVHRSENPLTVQAYHSSTRAALEGLLGLTLDRELKNLRLAAFVMREAATPTILIGGDKRINIVHVVPNARAPRGMQFEQQAR